MENALPVVVLFLALTVMLSAGVWIPVALGAAGILTLIVHSGAESLGAIGPTFWGNATNFVLVAIPLFIFMGEILVRSDISEKFYRGLSPLSAKIPGGLLHTNIGASAIFSAVSGSSVATAAAVGGVAIPAQKALKYDHSLLTGSLAAGGTLGLLIPPSAAFILYGAMVGESVAQLFLAGVVPGLVLSGLFVGYIFVRCLADPDLSPRSGRQNTSKETLKGFLHVIPVLSLIVFVLGAIFVGVATPTEAAALGVLGAGLLAVGNRSLSQRVMVESLKSTVSTTCMVLFIVMNAQVLSFAVVETGISRDVTQWVLDLDLGKWGFFVVLCLIYVVLGFFMDGVSIMLLTIPLVYPIVAALGFDPLWFGVVLVILIELGLITPPIGLNLFILRGIDPDIEFSSIVRGAVPFAVIMALMIVLLVVLPDIALWLPGE